MINSIQILRAIAAIYVVIYHAGEKLQIENSFILAGDSGVDLFFIISGFVITYTTLNKNVEWKGFMVKRIVRIVPLYWFLTFLFSGLLFFSPSLFQTYTFDSMKVVYSLLFIPQVDRPVVYTGWTLNYEMYFYALFSLGLLASNAKAPLFVSLFLLICVIAGTLFTADPQTQPPAIQLVTSQLLVEFVFGILLFYVFKSGFRLSFFYAFIFILTGISCFYIFDDMDRLFSYGIPWLFIFIGVVFHAKRFFECRPLLFLGDASYSIYLAHVFTLPAIHMMFDYFSVQLGSSLLMPLFIYSSIGVISGTVCFVVIERPLSNYFNAKLRRQDEGSNKQ